MEVVDTTQINSFAPIPAQTDFPVSPSDQLITLTSDQLQDIIKEAIQPLQDEISDLKATVAHLQEDVTALEATANHQEENQLIQLRLIADLRKEPQPMQRDRGEILRALIAANGGKMLAKDARQKMHLGKEQFSLLISRMGEYIEIKHFHQDKRQLVLIIK